MSKSENKRKKYYYPIRDAKDHKKVSLIEITEAQYRALYPEIWATQKREQYHHRCMCTKKYIWKCDGNCDLCEFHAEGDTLSLDYPIEDGSADLYGTIPDNNLMEDIVADALLLEQLIAKLHELDPDADKIVEMLDDGKSGREIAKSLDRPQRTFSDQMNRYRKELRKIRGY